MRRALFQIALYSAVLTGSNLLAQPVPTTPLNQQPITAPVTAEDREKLIKNAEADVVQLTRLLEHARKNDKLMVDCLAAELRIAKANLRALEKANRKSSGDTAEQMRVSAEQIRTSRNNGQTCVGDPVDGASGSSFQGPDGLDDPRGTNPFDGGPFEADPIEPITDPSPVI